MEKRIFILSHADARQRAIEAIRSAPDGFQVVIKGASRTLAQNATQWPILEAFERQLLWPVNGQMTYLTPEEWKDVLTAGFRRETARLAMGIDGRGVVMLGQRTSKFSKSEFSDWIEFLYATAASRGVDVSAK